MTVSLDDLNFTYKGSDTGVLKNLNLTVDQGECILLTGPSGCGKTTITRILNGLIPSFYKGNIEGKALLDGKPVSEMKSYEIAEHIGSVFQNPRTQFFNVDTDSEIAFGLENEGISTSKINERIDVVTKELNIEKLRQRDIFDLSGGEKQKIAFASVYAMSPDIYLLDEPSSNLDTEGIAELAECLRKVKEDRKTMIISEHRIYYLMDIVDKIVYMRNGEIKDIYSREEFLRFTKNELYSMGLRISRKADSEEIIGNFSENTETDSKGLVIKNVSISRKKKTLLKNIELQFRPGEIVGLIGRNGVGKTTLIRTITGLHKEYTGEIMLDGSIMKWKELRKRSYLVMQDVNYQLFAESVRAECSLGLKGVSKERVDKTLEMLGLLPFADRHPNTLSGGQKQKLALAVSMISEKQIIALDEPTSGLDHDNMVRTSEIIRQLAKEGKIVIVVTHDEEFILNCCDRVVDLAENAY
jgi:energy-coupling factor transport system ATP-binding protein